MSRFPFEGEPAFRGHLGRASCLAFSPDGERLGSGGEYEMRAAIWRVADGMLLKSFRLGSQGWMRAVDDVGFSVDGEEFYVAADTGLWVFETETGGLRWSRRIAWTGGFRLSPDRRHALCVDFVGDSRRTRVLDLAENRFLKVKFATAGLFTEFSRDGRFFSVDEGIDPDSDPQRRVFETLTGRGIATLAGAGTSILIEVDGRNVLATIPNDSVEAEFLTLLDLEDGKQRTVYATTFQGYILSASRVSALPASTQMVVANMNRPSEAFDLADPLYHREIQSGLDYDVTARFSDDGGRLAIGDASGTIRIVSPGTWGVERFLLGGARRVEGLTIDETGRWLACEIEDRYRRKLPPVLWDLREKALIGPMSPSLDPKRWEKDGLLFDPDLGWLGAERSPAAERRRRIPDLSLERGQIAVTPNARFLTWMEDRHVIVSDLKKEEVVAQVSADRDIGEICRIAISANGRKVALSTFPEEGLTTDGLTILHLDRGAAEERPAGDDLSAIAWHPAGRFLAIGDAYEHHVIVEGFVTHRARRHVFGHGQGIRDLIYTPDGRTLISAAIDGQIILWDASKLTRQSTLLLLPDGGWAAYSPEGEFNGSPGAEAWFGVDNEDGRRDHR